MKSVQIAASIEADPRLLSLVRRASEVLERTVGPYSSPGVSAEWNLIHDDQGRPLLRLSIADFTGTTDRTVFFPEDLKSDWDVEGRMLKLWGDLLQVRSHKQLDKILKAVPETGTLWEWRPNRI